MSSPKPYNSKEDSQDASEPKRTIKKPIKKPVTPSRSLMKINTKPTITETIIPNQVQNAASPFIFPPMLSNIIFLLKIKTASTRVGTPKDTNFN